MNDFLTSPEFKKFCTQTIPDLIRAITRLTDTILQAHDRESRDKAPNLPAGRAQNPSIPPVSPALTALSRLHHKPPTPEDISRVLDRDRTNSGFDAHVRMAQLTNERVAQGVPPPKDAFVEDSHD